MVPKLGTSKNRSEVPVYLKNVVLEKDCEYRLDRSYEKWRSITPSNRKEISYK